MKWDGYKVGGYEDHPKKDPIKSSSYEKSSEEDKKQVKRRFRVDQIQKRRLDVDESTEKSTARKIIEWRRRDADRR